MTYGLKDIQSPFIQFKGTLGECFREATRLGLCGIYRLENDGWHTVAKRYWSRFILAKHIRTISKEEITI